jgi:Secretory lipase
MRRMLVIALTLTLGFTGVVTGTADAAPKALSAKSAAVLPPDTDPFYVPPAGYASTADGTVLRSRPITAIYLAVPVPVKAYQVLYKSEDGHHNAVAEAATILVPDSPWTGRGQRPLVAYQLAEDSVSTRCQPSYTLQVGLGAPTPASTYEVSVSLPALAKGYAIVYADYEGPDSQFIAGSQTAHAVLDGIRAAEHYAPAGLSPTTPVGLWGYSGGGFATTWASEQQASYAPELNVVGAAAGGVPADLKAMFAYNDGNLGAGLVILAVIGLSRAYPEAGIAGILNDKGKQLFAANANNCTLDTALFHPFDRIENYTTISDVIDSPQAAFLFKAADTGQGVPKTPVYNYQALGDELVPVAGADRLVQKYCDEGVVVQKSRLPIAEHITGEIEGALPALQFLTDRFDGKPAQNDC